MSGDSGLQQALRLESIAGKKKLLAEAELYKLQQGPERRRERVFEARTVLFSDEVDSGSVVEAVELLRDLEAESDEPIVVYLNSVGGDVFDGLLLFDFIAELRQGGIHVETRVKGLAASMGSVLAQAGDTRVISANSWYMVHEPSTILWGKAGDIKREAKLMEALHKQLCGIIAERSTLTQAEVIKRSTDKDWWVPAAEAVDLGFFDELA